MRLFVVVFLALTTSFSALLAIARAETLEEPFPLKPIYVILTCYHSNEGYLRRNSYALLLSSGLQECQG
jgi:hypothetical protein